VFITRLPRLLISCNISGGISSIACFPPPRRNCPGMTDETCSAIFPVHAGKILSIIVPTIIYLLRFYSSSTALLWRHDSPEDGGAPRPQKAGERLPPASIARTHALPVGSSAGTEHAINRLAALDLPIDDFAGERRDVRVCTIFDIRGQIRKTCLGRVVFAHFAHLV